MSNDNYDFLNEPSTVLEETMRALAEAAMSCTHHDIGDTEPEYIHEVNAMEHKFRPILQAFLRKSEASR